MQTKAGIQYWQNKIQTSAAGQNWLNSGHLYQRSAIGSKASINAFLTTLKIKVAVVFDIGNTNIH